MRVIGLMSGTSYDAIDVCAAELTLQGDAIVLTPLGALRVPYADQLRQAIHRALPPGRTTYADVCRLDTELGHAFASAAEGALAQLCHGHADLVVSHGQTMYHWVDPDGRARGTLQLGQPAWIAEATGLPVVSDLRSRDIARGGQGAPLVSIFDVLLLGGRDVRQGALNLGGIANLTVVADDPGRLAYDIGPANALIDAAVDRLTGQPFDVDGKLAAAGVVHTGLLDSLLAEPYYDRVAPKSTGKELFNWSYLADRLATHGPLPAADVVATATELTARVVTSAIAIHGLDVVFASGGGTRNGWLMGRLGELAPEGCEVRSIDEFGIGVDDKEAYAFALLGFLSVHGLPGTVPSCTGAHDAAVLGSITPGGSARASWPQLPADQPTPTKLVVVKP